MKTLKQLFLHELAERYDAEKRLLRALPRLTKMVTCPGLQTLIQTGLNDTVDHLATIEAVFVALPSPTKSGKCEATSGLLREGDELMSQFKNSPALNAAMVSLSQKLAHHAIASYGCLHEWATLLDDRKVTQQMKACLDRYLAGNQALIALARTQCNREALGVPIPSATVRAPRAPRAAKPARKPAPSLDPQSSPPTAFPI
jgi:ferritin-like metal-binding protein YciE